MQFAPAAVQDVQRLQSNHPWLIWMTPLLYAALLSACRSVIDAVLQQGHVLPMSPSILLYACAVCALVTVPLYQAPSLPEWSLRAFLLVGLFTLHYVLIFTYHAVGRPAAMLLAVVHGWWVATNTAAVLLRSGNTRLRLWTLFSVHLPLAVVPPAILLVSLTL
jgi:hypothetical protein